MKEFGLQLYSIRDYFTNEENTKTSFRKIAEMGYTTAQTAGTYDYISPEKFSQYAKQYNIKLFSTHYDYNLIKNDIEGTVRYHKIIGADYVGIGGKEGIYEKKEKILEFIDEFNSLAKIYKEHGFKLTYHNHAAEFIKVEGKCVFDYLIEGFDPENISFCLDTYWAQYAGVDVCGLIEKLSGRIDIIHLKDMTAWVPFELKSGRTLYAPRMIEVGRGNMDFKRIIEYAKRSGTKYFVVEDEYYTTGDSMESVKTSADYIKANLPD
jgi:sugar phosphate isomerase/epimerase